MNLYYWAMQWTVHAANDWKLGEDAYEFELRQKQLWAIGLETLEQIAKQTWPGDLKVVRVMVQQKRAPRRVGVILLSNIHWGQYRNRLVARATEGDGFDPEPSEFGGEDRVLNVTFPRRPECVPWKLISSMLEQAFVNAEDDLKAAKMQWGGPPFYEEFASGQELLEDARDRGLRPQVLLRDLAGLYRLFGRKRP